MVCSGLAPKDQGGWWVDDEGEGCQSHNEQSAKILIGGWLAHSTRSQASRSGEWASPLLLASRVEKDRLDSPDDLPRHGRREKIMQIWWVRSLTFCACHTFAGNTRIADTVGGKR